MNLLRLLLILNICSNFSFSQETLQIMFTRLGVFKKYTIHTTEILEYKLKGQRKFKEGKIVAMQDSTILFENDEEIKLSHLKCVRFKKNNHLINAFQQAFIIAGFGFITIDTFNNLIFERPEVLNKKAVLISAALLATSVLLKRMSYKKVRITKNKILRIVNFNYQNLNTTH